MNIVDNWFIEIDNKIENSDASGDLCFSMGTVELPKRRCIGSSCDHIFSRSSSGRICILSAYPAGDGYLGFLQLGLLAAYE